MRQTLNLERFGKIRDLKIEEVEVPEWDCVVRLKQFSDADRLHYMRLSANLIPDGVKEDQKLKELSHQQLDHYISRLQELRVVMLSRVIVDESGAPFIEKERLLDRNVDVIHKLWEKVEEMNHLDIPPEEEKKDVTEV